MLPEQNLNLSEATNIFCVNPPSKKLLKMFKNITKRYEEKEQLCNRSSDKLYSILVHDRLIERFKLQIHTQEQVLRIFEAYCQLKCPQEEQLFDICKACVKIAADLGQVKIKTKINNYSKILERNILQTLQWSVSYPSFLKIGEIFMQWIQKEEIAMVLSIDFNIFNKIYQQEANNIISGYQFFWETPQKLIKQIMQKTFQRMNITFSMNLFEYFQQCLIRKSCLQFTKKYNNVKFNKTKLFPMQRHSKNQQNFQKGDLKTIRENLANMGTKMDCNAYFRPANLFKNSQAIKIQIKP